MKYETNELSISVPRYEELRTHVFKILVINDPELALKMMYDWEENMKVLVSEVLAIKVMNNIGIVYIGNPSGRNKGYMNAIAKLFTRDLFKGINQILIYSCRVTLTKTGLKEKKKRLPRKYYS